VPVAALETFWKQHGLDQYDVRDTVNTLVDASLVRRGEDGALSLHDIIRDYLTKTGNDMPALHSRLLEAYAAACPHGWASGPNDGYFLQRLCHHLIQAGRLDEMVDVLTDLDFVDAKSKAGLVYDLVADYNLAIRALTGQDGKSVGRQQRICEYVAGLTAYSGEPDRSPLPDPPPRVDISPAQACRRAPGRMDSAGAGRGLGVLRRQPRAVAGEGLVFRVSARP